MFWTKSSLVGCRLWRKCIVLEIVCYHSNTFWKFDLYFCNWAHFWVIESTYWRILKYAFSCLIKEMYALFSGVLLHNFRYLKQLQTSWTTVSSMLKMTHCWSECQLPKIHSKTKSHAPFSKLPLSSMIEVFSSTHGV